MTTDEIKRIVAQLGVGDDANKYYVYGLFDSKGLFYIGKGEGSRILDHKTQADEIAKLENDPQISKEIKAKISRLIANNDLSFRIIKWGLTESEAFMAESSMINLINSMQCVTLTNSINGHCSEKEKNSRIHKTCAMTLKQFLRDCAVEEVEIDEDDNTYQNLIFVRIQKMYPDVLQTRDSEKIYDGAKGFWNLSLDRAKKAKYVLALYNDIVLGVYPVNENSWCYMHEYDSQEILKNNERKNDIEWIQKNKNNTVVNTKERIGFTSSKSNIPSALSDLVGKTIKYKKDKEYIKQQNTHYSKNWVS